MLNAKKLIISVFLILIAFPSFAAASSLQDGLSYYNGQLNNIEQEIKKTDDRSKLIELVREENKLAAYQRAYEKAIESAYGTNSYQNSNSYQVNYNSALPYINLYKAAAERYGIDWALLAAVHDVETSFSTHPTMVSSAGALGPMQFMPGTWAYYGVDADGDGKADPFSLADAIYSAANYLSASGAAEGNIKQALFAYNHSIDYGLEVMAKADKYRLEVFNNEDK